MHRLNSLRWAAVPVGLFITLSITRCVDSLSDDCTKTLTCGTESQVTLDNRCQWRYPDGGLWTGGPTQDPVTRLWKWPDGTETATQDFRCAPDGAGGADAGAGEPDCMVFGCDSPQQCDEPSRRCVECLDNTACAANVPMGDAGAAGVCDTLRKECVRCVDDTHCMSPTSVCKVFAENTDRNECVECTVDRQCTDAAEPVCDPSSNECTLRCTEPGECIGSADKSVCNTTRGLCVECVEGSNTCSGETPQCNTTTNECVQCVDDAACASLGQVCDETSNRCVQCETNDECAEVDDNPVCNTETKLCVGCLSHTDCTATNASRCNAAEHVCAPCTADVQCEGGAVCNTGTGACVQCTSDVHCAGQGINATCNLMTGACVQCTSSDQCLAEDAALCASIPADGLPNTCVGCRTNDECGKLGGKLCSNNRVCVECTADANCSNNPAASLCSSGGACIPCAVDGDCGLVSGLNACLLGAGGARCVECVNDTHCEGNPDGPACKTTNAGGAAGPGRVNECVECISNANCTNPAASKCVQNDCVPCTSNTDCTQPGLGVCDLSGPAGVCVQCTGTQRQACGANVCDSLQKTCRTDALARSAELCDQCFSDDHCAASARCVEQVFQSTEIGYFCFPVATPGAGPCAGQQPFFDNLATPTIDGNATICRLRSATCPALDDYARTACDNDADCGVAGLADGFCGTGDGGDQCTIACMNANDCSGGDCIGSRCTL